MSDLYESIKRERGTLELSPVSDVILNLEEKLKLELPTSVREVIVEVLSGLKNCHTDEHIIRFIQSWSEKISNLDDSPYKDFLTCIGSILIRVKI